MIESISVITIVAAVWYAAMFLIVEMEINKC
jgi:hypothetical protein